MENNDEMVGVGLGIHYGERAAYCMVDECNLLALRCGAVHLGHVVYSMMYMMYMMPPARKCARHRTDKVCGGVSIAIGSEKLCRGGFESSLIAKERLSLVRPTGLRRFYYVGLAYYFVSGS